MRILLLSFYYPPIGNPRAYRWSGIAERLAALGHQVDVITSRPPDTEANEVMEGVSVFRAGSSLLSRIRRRLTGSAGGGARSNASLIPSRSGVLGRALKTIHDATWKKAYWPDHACLWYFPARLHAARRLRDTSYDALVSVSPEFVGHLVGLSCKQSHPDLPWLVDFGDPFSLMHETPANNMRLYGALNRRVEQKVLESADRVALTNAMAQDVYERSFPEVRGKASVILPMSRMAPVPPTSPGTANEKLVLAYFGVLYRNIREPDGLLNLVRRIVQLDPTAIHWLDLRFYGDVSTCVENFEKYADLKGVLRFPGYVPFSQLARHMSEADVLVNLGNTTQFQLPSKGADYIASGLPILNLSRHKKDTFADLLQDHPLAMTLIQDEATDESQARDLLRFLRSSRGRRLPEKRVAQLSIRFSVETIASQYLELMSQP